MTDHLSNDEKRVFSDQISLLKNENERLTDENTLLAEHNHALRVDLLRWEELYGKYPGGPVLLGGSDD